MIIGVRTSDFINPSQVVDSSGVCCISSNQASGEQYIPIGRSFYVDSCLEKMLVVEKQGDIIIERYMIKPKKIKFNEYVINQIFVRIIPITNVYNEGKPLVLLDRLGIQRAIANFNDKCTPLQFINQVLFKCVLEEFIVADPFTQQFIENWQDDAASNKGHFLSHTSALNWNAAPFFNYPSRPKAKIDPYQIAFDIQDMSGAVFRGESGLGLLQLVIEEQFIPQVDTLFPNKLSSTLLHKEALNLNDISQFLSCQNRYPTINYPTYPFKMDELKGNSIFINHYGNCESTQDDTFACGWMELCEMVMLTRYTDWVLEYILPKWEVTQRSNRYGCQITHFDVDAFEYFVDIVRNKLVPQISQFRLIKTYDNLLILEVYNKNILEARYVADITLASIVSQALGDR